MFGIRCALGAVSLASALVLGLTVPARAAEEWLPFAPAADALFDSPIGLRHLNESVAGENGRIAAKDGKFVHGKTGKLLEALRIELEEEEQDDEGKAESESDDDAVALTKA